MKRFYLFAFIILGAYVASGQTLGIKINPAADIEQGVHKPYFGLSAGLYYNQKIYKFFGVSAGVEYTQINSGFSGISDAIPFYLGLSLSSQQQRTHLIETPVDITLLFTKKPTAKCLIYFTIGYAFGEVFEQRKVNYYDNKFDAYNTYMFSQSKVANTLRLGLEARYNPKPRINLAFGIQYKYAILPESNNNYSNEFNVIGAYIKTGFNFLHRKRVAKKFY